MRKVSTSRHFFFRIRCALAAVVLVLLTGVAPVMAARLDKPMEDPSSNYDASISTQNCTCNPPSTWPTLCDYTGETKGIKNTLLNALEEKLMAAANELEKYIGDQLVDGMMQAFLVKLNSNEMNLIDWWDTMWFHNFHPGLQDTAEAVVTASQDQLRAEGASGDAATRQQTEQRKEVQKIEAERAYAPSEQVCVMATTAGGMGRATNIAKSIQKAYEQEAKAAGLNKAGTPGASGATAAEVVRHDKYEMTFCDPNDNNGQNTCAPQSNDPRFWNADIQPTKFIFDKKTIPLDQDKRYGEGVQAAIDNVVGATSADTIPPNVIEAVEGRELWLARRPYLARHALVRSLFNMTAGWRTPGTGLGPWTSELRKSAGVSVADVSGNPSYREALAATSVEKFNSGKYANDNLTDPLKIEREKLALNAIYLMQLRDYYELLERHAATLAIQVSLLAEQRGSNTSLMSVAPMNQ